MGAFSRSKGARGERMWRDVCRAEGYDAERGCQMYDKGSEIADVIGLPGIHVEVKNVEKLNLRDAMAQSIHDAEEEGKGNIPIVAHKKNRCPWLVTLRAEDWFKLYREWEAGSGEMQDYWDEAEREDWDDIYEIRLDNDRGTGANDDSST